MPYNYELVARRKPYFDVWVVGMAQDYETACKMAAQWEIDFEALEPVVVCHSRNTKMVKERVEASPLPYLLAPRC